MHFQETLTLIITDDVAIIYAFFARDLFILRVVDIIYVFQEKLTLIFTEM